MTMHSTDSQTDRFEIDVVDRLRHAMRYSGVSSADLVEYVEVSRNTVSNWINGRVTPRKRDLRLIALRTGFPLEWLETGCTPSDLNREPTGSGSMASIKWLHPDLLELPALVA